MLDSFLEGINDDELPNRIPWSGAHDAAVKKWQSEACFQEQVLKKLFRVAKKVDSIFPDESRSRRLRLFKSLRLGEKYSTMEDVLVKDRSTPMYLSYFQPQPIGEHYINGWHLFLRIRSSLPSTAIIMIRNHASLVLLLYSIAMVVSDDHRNGL